MELSSSLEDYLETIQSIVAIKGAARPSDIARLRNVAASSVTTALRNLSKNGLVNHAPYDVVTLTPEGDRLASGIARKHAVFKEFFMSVLGINEDTSDECACRMEHIIPDDVLERLVEYLSFAKACQFGGRRWVDGKGFVCDHRENRT
ncbi:MAG: metal-dependent transcriptional regulator [Candidatus Sabulitectum sp.]|nr:metal-dependent transcriptional regulator [Candidatus Sabulitectum sp.]